MPDAPSLADTDPIIDAPEPDEREPVQESLPDEQPNAVLILRFEDETGIQTDVATLGDVKATEVQTIIELGRQSWRRKIGLDA